MLKIIKLDGLNAISIQKDEESRAFLASKDSFVISIPTLSYILLFLLKTGFMSPKVLEGVLEEFNTRKDI